MLKLLRGGIVSAFFLALFFLLFSKNILAVNPGLGVCHWPGTTGIGRSGVSWFYWGGGGGQEWKEIEPVKGSYQFAAFDSALQTHFASYPNTSFVLNIFTAQPPVVPNWAKPTRTDCPVADTTCNPYGYIETNSSFGTFAPWNASYLSALNALVAVTATHIKSTDFNYRDKIAGINIMAGGYFGEMITGTDAGTDDYNKWIDAGYTDDLYRNTLVNQIIPIYKNAFAGLNYPFVIQLGYGLNGQVSFLNSVLDAIYQTHPDLRGRIYYKFNNWSQNSWNGDQLGSDQVYSHDILKNAASYTQVGWEPGALPTTETSSALLFQNLVKTIEYTRASFFCLQEEYYNYLDDSKTSQIAVKLEANATPFPTSSLSPTRTPACLVMARNGDYDCNGVINLLDFEAWKTDYLAGRASLSYFEYFRRVMY